MPTILITGFGPFPGAPYNPTINLVERLTRLRRPALAAFVHVPLVNRSARPLRPRMFRNTRFALLRGNERVFDANDLFNIGSRVLVAMAVAVNRT
jgi:hypothetical protein